MPSAQRLQIHLFGFSASANGETGLYSLAVVALEAILPGERGQRGHGIHFFHISTIIEFAADAHPARSCGCADGGSSPNPRYAAPR